MLSRYPITETDFLLLPRFWDDGEDNQHQRQCLRARVQVPGPWGAVELFTTHLSLSERARNASVALYDDEKECGGGLSTTARSEFPRYLISVT